MDLCEGGMKRASADGHRCLKRRTLVRSVDANWSIGPEVCDESLLRGHKLGWLRQKNLTTLKQSSQHHSGEERSAWICFTYLPLKKSMSPSSMATVSKTSVKSQASGVTGAIGPGSTGSSFGPGGHFINVTSQTS